MANPASNRHASAMRNLSSAGNSATKFTRRSASNATVATVKWLATDHLDMKGAYSRMPSGMGALYELKYILMQFLIRMVAIAITAVIFFVGIVLLTGSF